MTLAESIERNKRRWARERQNFQVWKQEVERNAQNDWDASDMRQGYCVIAPMSQIDRVNAELGISQTF